MFENLKDKIVCIFIGFVLACSLFLYLVPKRPQPPMIPASTESSNIAKKTNDQSQKKQSVTKEYNCTTGALSKETTVNEETEKKIASEKVSSEKKIEEVSVPQPFLSLKIGPGMQLIDVEKFSDLSLEKVKPQIAVGAEYGGHEILGSTDGNKNHNIFYLKSIKLDF